VIPPLFHKVWKESSCGKHICFIHTKNKIFSLILVFSLIFGVFFPAFNEAQAGFFSSILGDQAFADATATPQSDSTVIVNSQNMDLLQASVSSTTVFDEKNNSKDSTTTNDTNGDIVSNNALLAMAGPLGISDGSTPSTSSTDQVSVYVVHKGDSISQIADMFGVSVNTILWANDMKKGDKMTEGQVLFILPVSGIELTVTKGQTLKSIATLYKADINDIASYNGITEDAQLTVGDKLIIPNGEKSRWVLYRSGTRI
jgi:LysM repeat protein